MIGASELLVIVVLGIILFKPEDYIEILKFIMRGYQKFHSTLKQTKNLIINEEIKTEISNIRDEIIAIGNKKYIKGDDGRIHEVFDLNDENLD